MVDLRAVPYELDEEGVSWVESTLASMTLEDKLGQLFINMGASRDEDYLTDVVQQYKFAGVRYNPGTAAEVHEQNRILQENSAIPLLIAANTEAGGNGACTDGTEVGYEVKVGATADPRYAYELGRVSGVEAPAIGCNWSVAPIVDIYYNWRNPIISNRSFGADPQLVLDMGLAYMKGFQESGAVCAAKHFPGDGVDERDQHLSFSVNSFSEEEWNETFGKVWRGLIDAGLPSLMAGHIHLPAFQRKYDPGVADEDLLPATLSKEIMTDLLRGEFGFNGVVVTDASHMVALTSAMKRADLVPTAIAAGCDLFLFFNDPDEDLEYMRDGVRRGILTQERIDEAVTRTLGLKARLGLHRKAKTDIVPPAEEALAQIGLPENTAVFAEIADKAITLVKNKQPDILPVTPERYRRILLVPVDGPPNPAAAFFGAAAGQKAVDLITEKLRERGHEVEIFESAVTRIGRLPEEERGAALQNMYAGKAPIKEFVAKYDLVINVAQVVGGMQPVERISWPASKGTPDLPWYVHEIPTIFISVNCPYHLADAPAVKCYINTYDPRPVTLELLLDKLASGADAFTGVPPTDAYCGFFDTRI